MLDQALLREKDEECMRWHLSAVAWQRHPDALPVLLRYASDHRASVRYIVASGLTMTLSGDRPLPVPVAQALSEYLGDPDQEVVWSVLYDLREFPSMFHPHLPLLLQGAEHLLEDHRIDIRRIAEQAVDALRAHLRPARRR